MKLTRIIGITTLAEWRYFLAKAEADWRGIDADEQEEREG